MAEAEEIFDELMVWDECTPEPDLTQIEDMVLELRKRMGEQMGQALLGQQEQRQPAEKMHCPQCEGEMVNKGQKGNRLETRMGNLEIERGYYYCPSCRQGFFPSGSAVEDLGEGVE
jgi:uncharacterized protein with PIN domain